MAGDPINGLVLGDCPYCGCPLVLNVAGPDGVVWSEQKVAEISAPTYSRPGFDYVRDAPPSFGSHPRGAYFIRYCGGAVNLFQPARWFTWQRFTNLRFNEIVGCYTVYQTTNSVGFTNLNIPPNELTHRFLPFAGLDPNYVDWLDAPVGSFPGVSDYALPAAWAANFDYEPASAYPASTGSKGDAQRGGACLMSAFYHGGGPINVDYDPAPGNVTPWPPVLSGNALQSPPYPSYSLYRAKPAFYFERLFAEFIGGPGTRTFKLAFHISNLSRGRWFALPRLSGGGILAQIVRERGVEIGGVGNFPLMHLPPGQTASFVASYTAPTTEFTLRVALDDNSGGATGIAPIFIPMRPQIQVTRMGRSSFFTSSFGNNSFRIVIFLRNSAVGPTSGDLKLTLIDTVNMTWPSPKVVDVVPLAGIGNNLIYRENGSTSLTSGVILRTTTVRWGTHVPANATSFLLKFTVTDGPVLYGTFEQVITLA